MYGISVLFIFVADAVVVAAVLIVKPILLVLFVFHLIQSPSRIFTFH